MAKYKMTQSEKENLILLVDNFNVLAEKYSQGLVKRISAFEAIKDIGTKKEYSSFINILSKATVQTMTPYKDSLGVKRVGIYDEAIRIGQRREREQLEKRRELLESIKGANEVRRGIEHEHLQHEVKYEPYGYSRQSKYIKAGQHYLDPQYRIRKGDRLLRENLLSSIHRSPIDDEQKSVLLSALNNVSDIKLYTLYMTNGWTMRFNYGNSGTEETEFNIMLSTLLREGLISEKKFNKYYFLRKGD